MINRGSGSGGHTPNIKKGFEGTAIVGGVLYFGSRAWKHHEAIKAAHNLNRRRKRRHIM